MRETSECTQAKATTATPARSIWDSNFTEGWRKSITLRGRSLSDPAMRDRVCIWIAPVQELAAFPECRSLLSPDEQAIIDQTTVPSARDSTMAARILLRIALTHAVAGCVDETAWRIGSLQHGKPVVGPGLPSVHFNIAHTERIAVVATAMRSMVGVDVECVDQQIDDEVIQMSCCAEERADLNAVVPHYTAREFLRLWTLKEAYTKMLGTGHVVDFQSIGFSFDTLSFIPSPDAQADGTTTHFESMFVLDKNRLNHLSVAIGFPSELGAADVTVMTLADAASGSLVQTPYINAAPPLQPKATEGIIR